MHKRKEVDHRTLAPPPPPSPEGLVLWGEIQDRRYLLAPEHREDPPSPYIYGLIHGKIWPGLTAHLSQEAGTLVMFFAATPPDADPPPPIIWEPCSGRYQIQKTPGKKGGIPGKVLTTWVGYKQPPLRKI